MSDTNQAGAATAPPNVQMLTVEDCDAKISDLRRALTTWEGLEEQWGSIDRLRDEIRTYEWLRGAQ